MHPLYSPAILSFPFPSLLSLLASVLPAPPPPLSFIALDSAVFPWLFSCWLERMSSCALSYELMMFKTAQCRRLGAEKFSLPFSGGCRPGRTQECQRGMMKELEVQVLFPLISVASFLPLPTHRRNQAFSLSLFPLAKLKENVCENHISKPSTFLLCK